MKKSVLLKWIAAGCGVLTIVFCFFSFLTAEGLDETINGFKVMFGGEMAGEDFFGFSFMNLLTLLLAVAGAVLCFLANRKENKMMTIAAAACLFLAGIFFFCGTNFWLFSSEITKGASDAAIEKFYEEVRPFYDLGIGAILSGIVCILGAVSAALSLIIDKYVK